MKFSKRKRLEADGLNLIFSLCNRGNYKEHIERTGLAPNICLPRTATEKFLWRKIFDRDPQFTLLSDKLAVKDHIARNFPDVPFAKVLWRGDDIRLAPPDLLAGPGFLKANHACNTNLKLGPETPEIDKLHAMTQNWLKLRWHAVRGQWAYKDIEPVLFIEEDLAVPTGQPPMDFAVFVFGDVITHFNAIVDHKTDHSKFARYNSCGRRTDDGWPGTKIRPLPMDFELPVAHFQVCEMAKQIAGETDHLRIDLMWNGEALHFGEVTVYSHGGYGFVSRLNDALLAEMADNWDLRRSWFLTLPQSGWRRLYADWLMRTLDAQDEHAPA